ncbi:MAG: GNAT family N-acetyltransferase [Alphaproteobacteria bacterium]
MNIALLPATPVLLRALIAEPASALAKICANGAEVRDIVLGVSKATLALYERTGGQEPWIGYFAKDDERLVGVCSFTGPPRNGEVEIAYFTFPPFEGRGVATAMTGALIELAWRDHALRSLIAFTLPETNASTRVLEKHGFTRDGTASDPEAGEVWRWRLKRPL